MKSVINFQEMMTCCVAGQLVSVGLLPFLQLPSDNGIALHGGVWECMDEVVMMIDYMIIMVVVMIVR